MSVRIKTNVAVMLIAVLASQSAVSCKPAAKLVVAAAKATVKTVTPEAPKIVVPSIKRLPAHLLDETKPPIPIRDHAAFAKLLNNEPDDVVRAVRRRVTPHDRFLLRLHQKAASPDTILDAQWVVDKLRSGTQKLGNGWTLSPSTVDLETYTTLTSIARRSDIHVSVLMDDLGVKPAEEVLRHEATQQVAREYPDETVDVGSVRTWASSRSGIYSRPVSGQKVVALLSAHDAMFKNIFGHAPSTAEKSQMTRVVADLKAAGAVFVRSPDELRSHILSDPQTHLIVLGHSVSDDPSSGRKLVFPDGQTYQEQEIILSGAAERRSVTVLTCYGEQAGLADELRFDHAVKMIDSSQKRIAEGGATASELLKVMLRKRRQLQHSRVAVSGGIGVAAIGTAVITVAPRVGSGPQRPAAEKRLK